MKSVKTLLVAFLIVTTATTLLPLAHSSVLTLTVFTTQPSYRIDKDITIHGDLTENTLPIQDWPVAVEVQDSLGTPIVTRTTQTNTSGTYILTFKLPANSRLETYTVYVSSIYKGEIATGSTAFELAAPVHNLNNQLGYLTIQTAIDAPETLGGHTLFVSAGTYLERPTVNKNGLTLIGENRDTTIIDGSGTGGYVLTVKANSTFIRDLTLRYSAPTSIHACIYLEDSYETRILNCKINNTNKGGGIYLYRSSDTIIESTSVVNCYYDGVRASYGDNITIINSSFATGSYGIFLATSNNTIVNTTARSNLTTNVFPGLYLQLSVRNTVVNCSFTGKDCGISMYGVNDTVLLGNTITGSGCGIRLRYDSCNNNVTGNLVAGNDVGVEFKSSASCGNRIYHNNFDNNTLQVNSTLIHVNIWDDGYPSGGNYWSDGDRTDLCNGPYQNETGSDGIGDTPYAIDGQNRDSYPLVKPYPSSPHDIGITNIIPTKTVVGQGFTVNVSVTIFNYGDETETFNVTIFCNETCIMLPDGKNYTTVSLSSKNCTTFALSWNTTGFALGNWTVSAYAWPVEGETNIMDNALAYWRIVVTIPGDVNSDYVVNILDAIVLGNSFLATPSSGNWNPNGDINGDNVENILDAIVIGNHFLQHYP